MTDDDQAGGSEDDDTSHLGHAIAYHALHRGTPVHSADGVVVGKVRRVSIAARENIFDGLDVMTDDGVRFVDAPEVARIFERAVLLTITADEVAQLPRPEGFMARRMRSASTARRAQRAFRDAKDRWNRR